MSALRDLLRAVDPPLLDTWGNGRKGRGPVLQGYPEQLLSFHGPLKLLCSLISPTSPTPALA